MLTGSGGGTASNPLNPPTSAGGGAPFGGASTSPALLRWAADQGWSIDPEVLANRISTEQAVEEIHGGDEHDVWHDKISQRAIKFTLDDKWIAGSPAGYAESMRRQNELFNTGYAFEGVADDDGMARLVTSQPWVAGSPASDTEIDQYFADRGYGKVQDAMYYNPKTRVVVGDAFPRNIIKQADGTIQPIDLQIRTATDRQADRYEDAISGRRRQALFMAAPTLYLPHGAESTKISDAEAAANTQVITAAATSLSRATGVHVGASESPGQIRQALTGSGVRLVEGIDDFASDLTSIEKVQGGHEHLVWNAVTKDGKGRAFKVLKAAPRRIESSTADYLTRLAFSNQLLGDSIRIEGVTNDGLVFWSQP